RLTSQCRHSLFNETPTGDPQSGHRACYPQQLEFRRSIHRGPPSSRHQVCLRIEERARLRSVTQERSARPRRWETPSNLHPHQGDVLIASKLEGRILAAEVVIKAWSTELRPRNGSASDFNRE